VRGLSKSVLAREVKLDSCTVARIERGEHAKLLATVKRIADVLDLKMEELVVSNSAQQPSA